MQILTNFIKLGQLLEVRVEIFQGYVKLNTSLIPQRMTAVCWINFHNYGSIPFSSEANLNFPLNCKDRSNHNLSGSSWLLKIEIYFL